MWHNVSYLEIQNGFIICIYGLRALCGVVTRKSYLELQKCHSLHAKSLALRVICQNKGERTAGIDGEKWLTPEAKMNA
ncbi:MAG TPA: group II intron reverse transcriptase/maturase, partial [Methanosarcinaceae archaeon]|nr:group II intron reverse transcriptase/maturase [Methanosarcinaceae archaeon]